MPVDKEMQNKKQMEYQKQVKKANPRNSVIRNGLRAFVVGGLICVIAQIISMIFQNAGFLEKQSNTAALVIMVFLGALLTGLGIYDNIGKFAGAGSLIPITGFANSIVAPAMEYKSEGFVYGVASKMFTIAGPVLVFGFIISALIGLIGFVFF
jgi:stage V sporulation protein AC